MSRHRICPLALIVTPLLLTPIAAQPLGDRIAVLEGATKTSLTLSTLDERQPAGAGSVVLSNLEMLGMEITNRTTQMSFDARRARRVERQGLTFVELPGGGGLYHYRRGTTFGFLRILPSGALLVVHEQPGVGTNGLTDPYEDRVGIAPDGVHACLLVAAGTALLARLDGQTFPSTNAPTRVLGLPKGVGVEPRAMALGSTHVFLGCDDDRVRRCLVADGNQPQDITPVVTVGSRLKDELAPSGDGSSVAFLLGPKDQYTIYFARTTGIAIALPPTPAKYEEPGYLPETMGGPRLLLDATGSRLMYVDSTIRDEIYMLDTAGAKSTVHITSDANFLPYIGVGILPAFAAQSLFVAVGNANAHDWFAVTAGDPKVRNLTNTGANATAPFDAGTLDPIGGFLASDGSVLSTERVGPGPLRLRRIESANASSTVIASALRAEPRLGSALAGVPNVLVPCASGDLMLTLGSSPALTAPPGVHLSTEVVSAASWYGVFDARDAAQPAAFALPIVHLHGNGVLVLPPQKGLRQIVLTRQGGALLNGAQLRYLAPGVDVLVPGASPIRIVLSGASN